VTQIENRCSTEREQRSPSRSRMELPVTWHAPGSRTCVSIACAALALILMPRLEALRVSRRVHRTATRTLGNEARGEGEGHPVGKGDTGGRARRAPSTKHSDSPHIVSRSSNGFGGTVLSHSWKVLLHSYGYSIRIRYWFGDSFHGLGERVSGGERSVRALHTRRRTSTRLSCRGRAPGRADHLARGEWSSESRVSSQGRPGAAAGLGSAYTRRERV
jgi:hypothetical protein